jgi:L-ascorbate metabolism protein UlaG (beta-lactamase superfamily)
MRIGKELLSEIESTTLSDNQVALWWLGQMGFVLKTPERICCLDAFLSAHPRRIVPPLLSANELASADFIWGSHLHTDHIDRPLWKEIATLSSKPKFVCPSLHIKPLVDQLGIPFSRFISLDDAQEITLGDITLTGIASAHELLNPDSVTGTHPAVGCVIEANGCTLYHSGDCCIYEGLSTKLSKWKFTAMILPINGRDAARLKRGCIGNMTWQEAVDLAGTLKSAVAIPGHFDMFPGNTEDPGKFVDYLEVKYPEVASKVCTYAEKVVLPISV